MLFGDLLAEDEARRAAGPERRAFLEAIVADFRTAFADIRYELRLEFRIINAQAYTLGSERYVIIYGGLGNHPEVGADCLAFVLLHETGHHLARGRRLPYCRSLACECESDHWAVTKGADLLERKSGRRFRVRRAVEELSRIVDKGGGHQACWDGGISETCWNSHWSQRWRAVVEKAAAPGFHKPCVC